MTSKPPSLWHLAQGGTTVGSYTSQQLADMGKAGQITSDMTVWRDGMTNWQPVSKVKGLNVIAVAGTPPPAPQAPAITVAVTPAADAPPTVVRGHVTIEKTGKSLKMQYALAVCTLAVGIVLTFSGMGNTENNKPSSTFSVGTGAVMFGLIWIAITKVKMWWHHG